MVRLSIILAMKNEENGPHIIGASTIKKVGTMRIAWRCDCPVG